MVVFWAQKSLSTTHISYDADLSKVRQEIYYKEASQNSNSDRKPWPELKSKPRLPEKYFL